MADKIREAALFAMRSGYSDARGLGDQDQELAVNEILAAVTPLIEQDFAERAERALYDYAGNYPADVFPPDGASRDAIAGTAMRHAYGQVAPSIVRNLAEEDAQ